ncbi:hypothetical protein [Pseudomonas sp. R5(2019)]|uniref:hypothetical protein n=1 Tax=Pseudomonas sp. R5(2019) TaxID=2697566 RepID=UPI0014121B6E|nr:hypothetical protein [Pseudomonas sp. R5(2019)]NBA97574.1 hypothetical protein [Pseudomonas sp. R5(2019)]
MHIIAYVMRRKSGLSQEAFLKLYAEHGQVMAMAARGLLRYEQYPLRRAQLPGDVYCTQPPAYDALSIYTYATAEDADYTSRLPEVIEDSERFIEFASMITLPVNKRTVV